MIFLKFEVEKFFVFFPLRLPFNWRLPSTYMIAFILQFASFFCIVQTCAANLGLLFGSCEILISFTDDLNQQLNDFATAKQKPQLKMKLAEFIEFHSTTKELSLMLGRR